MAIQHRRCDQHNLASLVCYLWPCSWYRGILEHDLGQSRLDLQAITIICLSNVVLALNINVSVHNCLPPTRVTSVQDIFDSIKRNLGVGSINRSELILFLWFCFRTKDPINRWPKLNRCAIKRNRLQLVVIQCFICVFVCY